MTSQVDRIAQLQLSIEQPGQDINCGQEGGGIHLPKASVTLCLDHLNIIWDVAPYQQTIQLSFTGQTVSAVDGLTVRNPVWRTKTSNKSSKHHYCLISTATTTHYFFNLLRSASSIFLLQIFSSFSFLSQVYRIQPFHISSYSVTYQLSTRGPFYPNYV